MSKNKKLRAKIIEKYGTISNFISKNNLNPHFFKKLQLNQFKLDDMYLLAQILEIPPQEFYFYFSEGDENGL